MIGTKLADRYEITSELGRGGMGVVYRARDPRLNREVAVKLVPPTQLSPDAEHRFQREAQVVAQMDHPAIVSIHDFGRHEGSLFFVMPLVQGMNLRSFLRQEDARLGDVLDVGIQVAEALEYSHARNVVHRDIKPENVMVTREEGVGVRVRVMDFGLARASTESRLTRTGTLVGTLGYLSPEQVASKEVDGRSDIYALGTLLYECVVGSAPFSGEAQSVLYRIVHEFPQSPRSLGADIDEELEAIILSCLEKEPPRRPQRAGDVAEALKRYRSRLRDSERERAVTGLTQSFQAPRAVASPFIGRGREFAELQQRLNAAVAGECQFVVVSGEPGVGKTRLLDELASLARARQIRVLRGRSVEKDRAFPYQGFCEIIQDHFRLKETASSPAPDLSDLAADLMALSPMLGEIPEIRQAATGDAKLARGGGAENRTQIFELLARTLTRIAGGRPLVLILEDLHGSEVTLEALPYIVTRLGPTPTLILGSYRTTEVDRRHPLTKVLDGFRGDRRFAAITLGPFSPSDHRLFVETLVGGAGLPDSLAQRLYEGTEGNPFFTKELVRSLLDSGGIARDDTGEWNLSGEAGLSAEAMPATIQEVVEQRIERLPDELREVLAVASVTGRSFAARDLEALAEGKGDVEEAIDRLLQEGYLEEERESRGEVLTFASGVVRDVLYASLSPRRRRSLHRRCAELLEQRHAGRLERVLPQLVHHFYLGDMPEKTVQHGLQLARASLESFSAEEAARSARIVLSFLDEEWEGDRSLEGEARMLLARAQRMTGDIEGALREAGAAVRVFEQQKDNVRAVGAILLAAETAWQARRAEETGRWVERGLAAARAAGDTESLRQLLSLAATQASLVGEYAKANQYLQEAARLAPEAAEAAGEEAPPSGGRLVVALANPVESIEPTGIETNEELEVSANVYETLLATDVKGNVVPSLCEKWQALEGGRAFLLTLRRGVRFSDDAPVTATDVRDSFEACVRYVGREMPPAYSAIRGVAEFQAGKAKSIEGIVVRGEDRLEIRLSEPLPIYPAMLTAGTGVVRAVPQPGTDRPKLLGTGPFVLASKDAERVVLERSPNYWKGVTPPLDAIEFRTYASAAAIAQALRAGEIDLGRDLLPEDLEEILRDPRFRRGFVETPKRNTYFVLFNSMTGPFARKEATRRALASIVRTNDLVWRTLGRYAQPAVCLIPPDMLGHDPGRRARTATVEDAREMLEAAGIETPFRLRASIHPLFRERYATLLTALLSLWSELGAEVEVVHSEMAAFLESWEVPDELDVLIGRWNADYDDPDNITHTLFYSQTGLWRTWFSSPAADRILEEARAESRPAVREGLYRKLESLLQDGALLIPLFHDIDYRLAGPKVRGLNLRGTAPYVNYPQMGKLEAAAPEAEPVRAGGGIVQVPIAGVVGHLDPAPVDTIEEAEVLPNVYEPLTRESGEGRIVPWLAAEWTVEEGGRRYRFRLRDDVRFHDGRRLTARDVRYSYERVLQDQRSASRWMFSPIRGARALLEGKAGDLAGFRIHSAHEFSIELENPVAFFPALVSNLSSGIIPEGSDPSGEGGKEGWVGTGPFRVVTFEPGQRLELERNRGYWRKGFPQCEGIVFTFGVTPKEMLSGLREGRFSLASDLFPGDVEALRRDPDLASGYRETPRLITYFVTFNSHRGPLADRALRQRLVRAVDVSKLVRQTLGRLAIPASGLIPPGLLGHEGGAPARAASSPSAPAEGPVTSLELNAAVHPIFFGGYSAFARELENAIGRLGVRIRPINRTMDEYLDAQKTADADLSIGRWSADYPDADTFVHIVHSQEGHLGRMCGSPELDRLIERGRVEPSPAARHGLYREIEEILAREAIMLPLYHEQVYRFARPELEGLTVSFGTQTVDYSRLRIR